MTTGCQQTSPLTILKDWFGCKYNNTNNLLELYNDFSSGAIDKGAPMAQSARICASAGRSKTPEDKCPVSVCDMCLSGKKTFVKKGAAWQEKKGLNQ